VEAKVPDEFEDKLRAMSKAEIRKGIIQGTWGSPDGPKRRLAQFIFEEKETEEDNKRFNKNLTFSRNLVIATWGLVIVTALLVIITAIKK
jgi:hypothetical protein